MRQIWHEFLRYYARRSRHGQIRAGDGIESAWMHSLLIVNNGTFLTRPVTDLDELGRRARASVEDAAPHQLPWLFFLYEPMVPESLLAGADDTLAAEGLQRASGLREMTAETLLPPVRPLVKLDIRRVTSDEQAIHALDINCYAYGMPLEISRSVLESGVYSGDPQRKFAYVGYVDDEPASTASILRIEDWMYVEAVATNPKHHRKGFAEAVMRHALSSAAQETGLTKTALDASGMGQPLYEQMGYTAGPYWRYYVKS